MYNLDVILSVGYRNLLRKASDPVGQINGLLIDLQILEHEAHAAPQQREQESR